MCDDKMHGTGRYARVLVGLQFITAAALVLGVRSGATPSACASALVLITLGGGLGVWAMVAVGIRRVTIMPEVHENTQLVTIGPYRLVRHPMYAALLLFCGGFVFLPFAYWKLGLWLLLWVVLIGKSRIEERQLTERFPEYSHYLQRSWRFIPWIF